jgi:fructose-specific phosphotransferase system IIC component
VFALPPALLVGAVSGYGLGQLAGHWPPPAAAWAAVLAWWLAGSVGGGVVGAFVAGRTNFALSAGAYLGAVIQSVLQVLLLPVVTYLVRWTLVLLNG